MVKCSSLFGRFCTKPRTTESYPAGLNEIGNPAAIPLRAQHADKLDAKGEAVKTEQEGDLAEKETKITIDETDVNKEYQKGKPNYVEQQPLTNADGEDDMPILAVPKDLVPRRKDSVETPQKSVSLQVTAEEVLQAIAYMQENDQTEYKKLENMFEGRIRSARPKCHTTALSLTAHGLALMCQQLHAFRVIHRLPTVVMVFLCGVLLQLIAGDRARRQRNSTEYANCMMFGLFWGCFAIMTMYPLVGIMPPSRLDHGLFFVAFTVYFFIYTASAAPMNTVQFFFGLSMLLGLLLTDVDHFTSYGPVKLIEFAAAGYFAAACALSLYFLVHALLHCEHTFLSLPLGRSLIDVIELIC